MPEIKEEFVTACIEEAKNSKCTIRHAALVAKGRRVLALATNFRKTHIRTFDYGRVSGLDISSMTHHAEPRVLMRANEEGMNHHIERLATKGAVLYSFRDSLYKLSKPCKTCLKMASLRGIGFVVYSDGTRATSGRIESLMLEE